MELPYCRSNGTLTLRQSVSRSSPINRLPEEMLVAIFNECMLTQWHSSEGMSLLDSGLFKWLRVSHVNKTWRNIAVGLPSLWSRITLPCKNPHLLRMLLLRSKNSPLYIRVRAVSSVSRDLSFDLIEKNSQRLATLEVQLLSDHSDPSRWQKFVTEGLGSTPLLTYYSLEILSDIAPSRTSQLKLKSAPECRRIQRLEMKGLPFSIVKEFCRPSLVCLSITYGEENISISALLSVLSTMSSLKELSVYPPEGYRISPITEKSQKKPQDALLPHLSSLKLSSDLVGPTGIILLDHLVIPSTTDYEIEIGEQDPTNFLAALERKLQGIKTIGERPPLKCGQLSAPAYKSISPIVWRAWATDVTFEEESSPKDTPLLCVHLSHRYNEFGPDVVSFFSNLVLSEVKTLQIAHAKRRFTRDSWHSFFTLTPNVQDLSVTGSSAGLCRVFQAMGPKAKPTEAVLLPQLCALAVGYGSRRVKYEANKQLVEELGSTLEARMLFHSRIQKFVISGLPEVLYMPRFKPLEKWVDSIVPVAFPCSDYCITNCDSSSECGEPKDEPDFESDLEWGYESDLDLVWVSD